MTNEARLFDGGSVSHGTTRILDTSKSRSLLEHWVAVERQLILDHSVGNVSGHLTVRNLVAGQFLNGKLGAIDRSCEVIVVFGKVEVDLPDLLREVLLDLLGVGNVTEVDHLENVAGRMLRVVVLRLSVDVFWFITGGRLRVSVACSVVFWKPGQCLSNSREDDGPLEGLSRVDQFTGGDG